MKKIIIFALSSSLLMAQDKFQIEEWLKIISNGQRTPTSERLKNNISYKKQNRESRREGNNFISINVTGAESGQYHYDLNGASIGQAGCVMFNSSKGDNLTCSGGEISEENKFIRNRISFSINNFSRKKTFYKLSSIFGKTENIFEIISKPFRKDPEHWETEGALIYYPNEPSNEGNHMSLISTLKTPCVGSIRMNDESDSIEGGFKCRALEGIKGMINLKSKFKFALEVRTPK